MVMPEMPAKVEHHHLLRAMDALMDNVDRVEAELAKQIRPLVDRDLTVEPAHAAALARPDRRDP